MNPNDPERKAFFAGIAKGYNDDIELETLHRNNLFRHSIACIIWIIVSILAVWRVIKFDEALDRCLITAWGVLLLAIILIQLCNIHRKYKRHVKHYLHARHVALQWKDGKLP